MRKIAGSLLRLAGRGAAARADSRRVAGPQSTSILSALTSSAGSSCTAGVRLAHVAAEQPAEQAHERKHHGLPIPAETGGPLAKYTAGLESGQYRPDPRQQLTIQMLQELYDDLQRAGASHHLAGQPHHKPRRRPSGLTMVDHIGDGSGASGNASSSGRYGISNSYGVSSYGGGGSSSSSYGGGSSSNSSSGSGSVSSWFSGLLGGGSNGSNGGSGSSGGGSGLGRAAPSAADSAPAVRGLYMYGGVGCGKTMLMDVFVHSAPPHFKVLRTHFHDFMLDVHGALRKTAREADPLLAVADSIASRARVLALDELFVTDVADAMILNRLFGRLWERGLVLVATSNRPPDDLYKGGLQRSLFMPFIHRLKTQCRAHDMASTTDYRRLAQHQHGLYFVTPAPQTGTAAPDVAAAGPDELTVRFGELAGGGVAAPARVEVAMGRTLEVPLAAGKACMFSFSELCGRPVAAADYIALTHAYHTLALRGVPAFVAANRSEAYRFVTLVDVMYEARTRLLVTAEVAPADLFTNILTQFEAATRPDLAGKPDVVVDDNLGFAKDRTISRLTEMQSLEYLLHHAKQHEPSLLLALQEAQSKSRKAATFAGH